MLSSGFRRMTFGGISPSWTPCTISSSGGLSASTDRARRGLDCAAVGRLRLSTPHSSSAVPVTVNLFGFHQAVKAISELPRKHGPDILNRNVLKVAIGAKGVKGLVQLTPKATVSRIESDLFKRHGPEFAYKLAVEWLRSRGRTAPKSRPPELGGSQSPQNVAAWMDWRRDVGAAAQAILDARKKSRAYIAAGWLFAAKNLAKSVRGTNLTRLADKNLPTRDDGTASQSFARAATGGSLVAGIFNTSRGAGNFEHVIPVAVQNVIADMESYLERKLGAAIRDVVSGTRTVDSVAA